MSNVNHDNTCHICQSDLMTVYDVINGYNMAECPNCNHKQVLPIPLEEDLLNQYTDNDEDSFYGNSCSVSLLDKNNHDKTYLEKYYSERISVVDENTKGHQSYILDYGCTNGVFVKALQNVGYENVYGFDIAEKLVQQGISEGMKLSTGDLAIFENSHQDYFDLIVAYHVFEHLPYPQSTLSNLFKMIKPGGHIYINVPHINSLQVKIFKNKSAIIDPPHHIHYFTKKSLEKLLLSNGFLVLDMQTPFWEKTTDTYLELKGFNHKTAVLLRYMASPLRWIIKYFSLGGTLSVVARKES